MSDVTGSVGRRVGGAVYRRANLTLPLALLLPYLIAFGLFLAYPILRALYMSFFDWGIFGPNEFVGLQNYVGLFSEGRFLRAFWTTVLFTALYVPLTLVVSLVLAVLLNGQMPVLGIFRTVFFMPIVINIAVAAIAIGWIIDPAVGILNRIFAALQLPQQAWLDHPQWALFAISLVTLWANAGFNIIILLAGLQNIPDELYEAARIDGSSAFQDFLYITVPLLRPILLLITVLSLVLALQVFGEVLLLTEGGPFGSTTVLALLLYEEGFEKFALGRAAAIGVIMTVVIAGLSFLQFRIFREP